MYSMGSGNVRRGGRRKLYTVLWRSLWLSADCTATLLLLIYLQVDIETHQHARDQTEPRMTDRLFHAAAVR